MCGIAVHAALRGSKRDREIIETSLKHIRHRGPDGCGVSVVPGDELSCPSVVLGHTRLAIVGNKHATQPLECSKGGSNYYLVHNGEIYNYKALRNQLIVCGDCKKEDFASDGDSEVLLACLAHRGIAWTLDNVRGMFAFVLVESRVDEDSEQQRERVDKIVLCRDEFGIKPLCYAFDETREKLFVCSELLAMPRGLRLEDPRDVLPASFVEVSVQSKDDGRAWAIQEHSYRSLGPSKCPNTKTSLPLGDQLLAIRSHLMDAVSVRIPDGVRMAVLLSGGLDSALICRLAADLVHPAKVYAFTIVSSTTINEPPELDSDGHFARIVVNEAPNIVHEEVGFSFQEGLGILPSVVKCMESTDAAMIRAGVPLYLLSKHISAKGFKVLLCGEGADESMAGYRLYEGYSAKDGGSFVRELWRRIINIDTSELQRVDRCTAAHGLEARVPFMDVSYVKVAMGINTDEKLSHLSVGRIQKYVLRKAFDEKYYRSKVTGKQILPDSVLYREKEQFADGVGRGWVGELQKYAKTLFPKLGSEEAERALYESYQQSERGLGKLIRDRKARRRRRAQDGNAGKPGRSQPKRWHSVRSDPDLSKLNLSDEDAVSFLWRVLGWSFDDAHGFVPSLDNLNKVIVSMLERVPFHNLTLLTRERRPPTMAEIREDMMAGIGGPCSVVNSFFAVLLDRLGFGPHVYLLSCEINHRSDCHVAILLQFKGLRYFADVANAKPYDRAVHLGDSSTFTSLDGSFKWGLRYDEQCGRMEVHHSNEKAISFRPASTVPYSSFHAMITRSRIDASFGPFLIGLRFCVYPNATSRILAVRDACVYKGSSTQQKFCAATKEELQSIAKRPPLCQIDGFQELLEEAIIVLDREQPGWFVRSRLHKRGCL